MSCNITKDFSRAYSALVALIETFRRGELLERFMARKLFGWLDKRYDKEYLARFKRNWRQ